MTTHEKRKGSFWPGTLLLLGLPAAAVVALAIYVWVTNARPQNAPMHVRVQPQVVFPWQEAHFLVTIHPETRPAKPLEPEPLDIAFLVDVSGSMTESIPTMANAVREMAREIAASKGDAVRFALVRFDSHAEINVPWTGDVAALDRGLSNLEPFNGGNDPRAFLQRMSELSATARPGAKRAMIFYSDGAIATDCEFSFLGRLGFCDGMTYKEVPAAVRPFREAGIDLFCVGAPGARVHPVMLEVTGSSGRIFLPNDIRDLASNFAALTDLVAARKTKVGAQLGHPLDGRHFRAPLEGTAWVREHAGTLRLDIGRVPSKSTTFGHPFVPLHAGVWKVASEPMRLTYANATGDVVEARAETRPRIFVLTWAALLVPLVPWLVWLLVRTMDARPAAVVEPPMLPVRTVPLPSALPSLPQPERVAQPLPTLFVGIGGAGFDALHAIRAELEQLHLGRDLAAYRFLALDLDQRVPAPSKFANGEAAIERFVAPREVVQLRDVMPRPGETPAHLSWLDASRYEHAAREELNLVDGSKGDRVLARLALYRWLGVPQSPLVDRLDRELETLAAMPSSGTRQIVVVASPAGGVGGGAFVDVLRLLRRLARARQAGTEILPEMIGLLVSTPDGGDPVAAGNRAALVTELESIALTGRFPRHITMRPGDTLLDRTDTESPFDWLLEVSDHDRHSAAAQSGAVASLLSQHSVRRGLLQQIEDQQRVPATVAVTGIHIVSTLIRDRVQADLLLRFLGPDVLLDIEPVRGGYAPRSPRDAEVQQTLEMWMAEEPPHTPVGRLFSGESNRDPNVLPSLRASIDRLLRERQPVLAAAVLRSFAGRHTDVDPASRFAAAVADALDTWVSELARFAVGVAEQQRSWSSRMDFLKTIHRRVYLDVAVEQKAIEEASRASLERWLGTNDTLSPLCERLFFAATPDGSVVLRSHIAGPAVLRSTADAARALEEIARALAAIVPSLRLSSAIARLDDAERRALATVLLDSGVRADSVLVTAPADLDEFRRAIGQPAGEGVRRDYVADDISAVRRMAVAPPVRNATAVMKPPYVESAERESERIRLRISERYRIRVPSFPPELRVAAADPLRFRSFARAYETGGIVRRQDESGVNRWYAVDRGEFLGFEEQNELAQAAASYVYSDLPIVTAGTSRPYGDFTTLDEAIARGGELNEESLVLAAIRVAEQT